MINIHYPFADRTLEAAQTTAGTCPENMQSLREGYHRHLRDKVYSEMRLHLPPGRPGRITMDNKQTIIHESRSCNSDK